MNETLYADIIRAVIGIAAAVLGAVLPVLAVQLLRKINIQLSAEQQGRLEYWAMVAAREAEEWAAAKVKAHAPAPSSSAKLERAVQQVLARVPGISRADAIAMVHAALPAIGAGATSPVALPLEVSHERAGS